MTDMHHAELQSLREMTDDDMINLQEKIRVLEKLANSQKK
jgi:hypothetical protein